MKNLLRVVFLIAVVAAARPLWTSRRAPALAYTDTQGAARRLGGGKPAVVVLWVTPCAYCKRSLIVLDEMRRLYPEQDLDVVGFYLNRADDASIDRIARDEGHSITMAQGQPSGEFVQSLTKGFNFRGTGRDIYVVGADGRYDAVDASDLKAPLPVLRDEVRSLLLNKLHLKERG
jgi:hypothetical protein